MNPVRLIQLFRDKDIFDMRNCDLISFSLLPVILIIVGHQKGSDRNITVLNRENPEGSIIN
jgi:hypothetical protein